RGRVHHHVVEVERDLVHGHAVVRHRQRSLDVELVQVVLDELVAVAVVVDGWLDRVLEVVVLPWRDLADVTVRVDDLLGMGGHRQSFPKWSRACAVRTSHSSWRENFLIGISGGVSSSHAPSRGSSCTTSSSYVAPAS